MRKGKRVYDPVTEKWSSGWWLPIYNGNSVVGWLPVWDKDDFD